MEAGLRQSQSAKINTVSSLNGGAGSGQPIDEARHL